MALGFQDLAPLFDARVEQIDREIAALRRQQQDVRRAKHEYKKLLAVNERADYGRGEFNAKRLGEVRVAPRYTVLTNTLTTFEQKLTELKVLAGYTRIIY